jgi:hypothetical protein
MQKAGEVGRRGVYVSRGILIASAIAVAVFAGGLVWMKMRADDSPPMPEELPLLFGAFFAAVTLVLSTWMLYLAGDTTVAKRGQELRTYGVRSSPDPILHLDQRLRIVALNPAAESRFNCSGDAVNGMPLNLILPQPAQAAPAAASDPAASSPESIVVAWENDDAFTLAVRTGARLSHLVQPLLGFAELALESLEPEHPVRADLEEIGRASARVALLAQALEMYGGARRIHAESVDLNAFLGRLETDLRFVLQPDTRLRLTMSPRPVFVTADPRLTRTALLLLVCNAEEAMPPGSLIGIGVDRDGIRISDSGAGLPGKIRETLFKPLASTKDAERGVGIGLHSARGAMRLQNADLKLVQSHEKGSVWALVFPKADRPSPQGAQREGLLGTRPLASGPATKVPESGALK